jgi:hypothetical protein
MLNIVVSTIAIKRSCNGFVFPNIAPNVIKTVAAANPPSRTLKTILHVVLSDIYGNHIIFFK